MDRLRRLLTFVMPYRWQASVALVLLVSVVAIDLVLPRLIQRLVDQGIARGDWDVILNTALLMLGFATLNAAGDTGSAQANGSDHLGLAHQAPGGGSERLHLSPRFVLLERGESMGRASGRCGYYWGPGKPPNSTCQSSGASKK